MQEASTEAGVVVVLTVTLGTKRLAEWSILRELRGEGYYVFVTVLVTTFIAMTYAVLVLVGVGAVTVIIEEVDTPL